REGCTQARKSSRVSSIRASIRASLLLGFLARRLRPLFRPLLLRAGCGALHALAGAVLLSGRGVHDHVDEVEQCRVAAMATVDHVRFAVTGAKSVVATFSVEGVDSRNGPTH